MSALFDHHVHSDRSDGTVSLAGRAATVKVRPHGVSDHYPWRDKLRNDDDVLRYIDDAARLGLRVGLEWDLGVAPPLRDTTRGMLHYLIGALHQVDVDGEWIRYDAAGAFLKGRTKEYDEASRFAESDPAHISYRELMAHRDELRCRRIVVTHLGKESLAHLSEIELEHAEDGTEIVI